MNNKTKSVKNTTISKSAQLAILEKFYQHLYVFLRDSEIIESKEDYFTFLFVNQKEIRCFLKKLGVI